MVVIIIKNVTAESLPIDNLVVANRQLLPNVPIDLTQNNKIYEIQTDPQISGYIQNGFCTINDGTRDLTQEEAINVSVPVVSTANIYDFNVTPEKLELSANDLLLAEDSEDNFKKKKVKAGNIIFLGSGTIVYSPTYIVETGVVYIRSKNPIPMLGMEFTVEKAGNYEMQFNGQFACLKGQEIILVAIYIDGNMIPDTRRIIEAESYVALQDRALIENASVGQNIHVRWWTNKGKRVIVEARSLKVERYV